MRHAARHASTPTPHAPATLGHVLHSAMGYDLGLRVMMLGRETAFRRRILDLAQLAPGESVLDVGCGTGTLAILASRRIGSAGAVHGIDPSPPMIARAARKARRAGADVSFQTAVAEALPFPAARFDVVLSTLMLHHLPADVRDQAAREILRVLRPGGRALIVDFGASARRKRGWWNRVHRHGHLALDEILRVLADAGFSVADSGALGTRDLQFVLARAPDTAA